MENEIEDIDVLAFVYHAVSPKIGPDQLITNISYERDHKSGEIILTDRAGKDWVVRSSDIRPLGC